MNDDPTQPEVIRRSEAYEMMELVHVKLALTHLHAAQEMAGGSIMHTARTRANLYQTARSAVADAVDEAERELEEKITHHSNAGANGQDLAEETDAPHPAQAEVPPGDAEHPHNFVADMP